MITFDTDHLVAEIKSLEARMTEPEFWSDRRQAAEVSKRIERARASLSGYDRLASEVEDIEVLHQMADELGDEAELSALEPRLSAVERNLRRLRLELTFSGEYDLGDCYLSINAGAGGTDSQDWAEMLLRMYGRFCERVGFKANLIEASAGDTAGLRSATLEVRGKYAYGNLQAEKGVHRLVRLSPFDSAHRRHTSFAAVTVVPVTEEAELAIDSKDLRIDTYRSSGAGGQHVNVTDSAVRITHLPTGLVVSCQNERSQLQNKESAMRVLRSRLAELLRQQAADRLEELQGELKENEWGSQIRSYVLHPYRLVKDHRTGIEVGNVDAVLDGDLTSLIGAFLESRTGNGDS